MEYREIDLPDQLAPFVRAVWRLSGNSIASQQLTFDAMPDGCVELIHRIKGQSEWQGSQPRIFFAGLCTCPAPLRFSGDAEFLGIRFWPWAWNRISRTGAAGCHDSWVEICGGGELAELCECEEVCVTRLLSRFTQMRPDGIGIHVPNCATPGELAEVSGRQPRTIQRWFVKELGMPPRQYMRLLRFQKAVEDGGKAGDGLAQEAIALGYSDQAHMARDFRGFSGKTARAVRSEAKGPFISS